MITAAVLKPCSADPKGLAKISQGIRGFFSVTAILKFNYLLFKG
jgi:hypothetical protein